jgi:uridine kinase
MKNKSFNKEIIEHISTGLEKWTVSGRKMVIGIDGESGIGKTTIAKELANLYPELIFHFSLDFFIKPAQERYSSLRKIDKKTEVFEKDWFYLDRFEKLVNSFKEGDIYKCSKIIGRNDKDIEFDNKVLLVDGIFLHNRVMFKKSFDKIIYLYSDKEIVETRRKRRRERLYCKSGDQDKLKKTDLMEQLLAMAHEDYVDKYNPIDNSDLVIKIELK